MESSVRSVSLWWAFVTICINQRARDVSTTETQVHRVRTETN